MKKIMLFLLGLWILGSCSSDHAQKTPNEVKQYSIEQFMDNETIFGSSFSHDYSKILLGSNISGTYDAYTIPVEGGEKTALTNSPSTIRPISFFPEDDRILYTSDNDGDEIYHLFLRNEDGSVVDLTPKEGARASFYGWAYDYKSFFYGSNARNP